MSKDTKDTKHTAHASGAKTHHEISATNLTPEEKKFLEQHIGEL